MAEKAGEHRARSRGVNLRSDRPGLSELAQSLCEIEFQIGSQQEDETQGSCRNAQISATYALKRVAVERPGRPALVSGDRHDADDVRPVPRRGTQALPFSSSRRAAVGCARSAARRRGQRRSGARQRPWSSTQLRIADGASEDVQACRSSARRPSHDMEDHPENPVPVRVCRSGVQLRSSTSLASRELRSCRSSGASTSDVLGRALIDPSRGEQPSGSRDSRAGTACVPPTCGRSRSPEGRAIDLRAYAGIVFGLRLTGSGGIVDVALDSLPGGGGAYFASDFTQLPTWRSMFPSDGNSSRCRSPACRRCRTAW